MGEIWSTTMMSPRELSLLNTTRPYFCQRSIAGTRSPQEMSRVSVCGGDYIGGNVFKDYMSRILAIDCDFIQPTSNRVNLQRDSLWSLAYTLKFRASETAIRCGVGTQNKGGVCKNPHPFVQTCCLQTGLCKSCRSNSCQSFLLTAFSYSLVPNPVKQLFNSMQVAAGKRRWQISLVTSCCSQLFGSRHCSHLSRFIYLAKLDETSVTDKMAKMVNNNWYAYHF